jgi:alpha-D-ribose 1-methylphosphonate 5-triphosphate diphosphatase
MMTTRSRIGAGRALGATVSEFPETRGGGGGGARGGEGVIMGAPNLVRGGSHAGKVAAGDLVAAGLVDALASDYHYPSPARAAFRLERDGMDLPGPGRWCRRGPRGCWALTTGGGWSRGLPGRSGRGGG